MAYHSEAMANTSDKSWTGKAAVAAGAAIGSGAVAAALLFVKYRRDRTPKSQPPHPEDAPETD